MAARGRKSVRRPVKPKSSSKSGGRRYWSQGVTLHSNAMDLEDGVFTRPPKEIAKSLKRSVERSTRLKSTPFRSAMSMLNFYENRAGKSLPASRKQDLHRAKDELRKLFGRPVRG
jgi:uncharacterized protein DUF3175